MEAFQLFKLELKIEKCRSASFHSPHVLLISGKNHCSLLPQTWEILHVRCSCGATPSYLA